MKRTIFTALLVVPLLVTVLGQQVSVADAEKAARNFFYERINQFENTRLDDIKILNYYLVGDKGNPIYYVFNINPKGYVIVSGFKNSIPVLAYSLYSRYSDTHQPPQFTAWIKQYYDQINYARTNQIEPLPEAISEWNRLLTDDPSKLLNLKFAKEVSPMLISTWDQGQFYNQMCPADPAGPGRPLPHRLCRNSHGTAMLLFQVAINRDRFIYLPASCLWNHFCKFWRYRIPVE